MSKQSWGLGVLAMVFFLIAASLSAFSIWASYVINSNLKSAEKGIRSLNDKLHETVDLSKEMNQRPFQPTDPGTLLKDIGKKASDFRDGCLSMCYDLRLYPQEWFDCLVRTWEVPYSVH